MVFKDSTNTHGTLASTVFVAVKPVLATYVEIAVALSTMWATTAVFLRVGA